MSVISTTTFEGFQPILLFKETTARPRKRCKIPLFPPHQLPEYLSSQNGKGLGFMLNRSTLLHHLKSTQLKKSQSYKATSVPTVCQANLRR